MADVTIEVKGLKELDKALAELAMDIQKKYMVAANRAGAMVIQRGAKARAPVRQRSGKGRMFSGLIPVSKGSTKLRGPGFLKANVRVWKAKRKVDPKATIAYHVGARKDAYYGKFLEFGTSKMAARPWLRPAFDSLWMYGVEETAAKLRELIRKNWKRSFTKAGLSYSEYLTPSGRAA